MSDKLWGGRFETDITEEVLNYTQTTNIDARMARYDILGSIAHLLMLKDTEIVDREDARAIMTILLDLHDKATRGKLELDPRLEDVHFNIESAVIKAVGKEIGGRLHTARSRNDQVVTDTRLYLREEITQIAGDLLDFVDDLLLRAKENVNTVCVGYTHGQPAQPITFGFWLTAYASMYLRDIKRLMQALDTVNQSPLGACALAGTSFPIDREHTATRLGFSQVLIHSLDATSSRDFVSQSISAFAQLMVNHSKMAEEIVVWNSFEFGLVDLSDAFCTGSSIMPQKKNAVVAELAKGRTGRVFGALMQSLTMQKGVGTGYNCDLQEDKPMLWDSIDTTRSTTRVLRNQLASAQYNESRALDLCWKNFSTITELANWLTKQHDVPFREAHEITGQLTQKLIKSDLAPDAFETCAEFLLAKGIKVSIGELEEILDPKRVLARQTSQGSTGPDAVADLTSVLATQSAELRSNLDASIQLKNQTIENLLSEADAFSGASEPAPMFML